MQVTRFSKKLPLLQSCASEVYCYSSYLITSQMWSEEFEYLDSKRNNSEDPLCHPSSSPGHWLYGTALGFAQKKKCYSNLWASPKPVLVWQHEALNSSLSSQISLWWRKCWFLCRKIYSLYSMLVFRHKQIPINKLSLFLCNGSDDVYPFCLCCSAQPPF